MFIRFIPIATTIALAFSGALFAGGNTTDYFTLEIPTEGGGQALRMDYFTYQVCTAGDSKSDDMQQAQQIFQCFIDEGLTEQSLRWIWANMDSYAKIIHRYDKDGNDITPDLDKNPSSEQKKSGVVDTKLKAAKPVYGEFDGSYMQWYDKYKVTADSKCQPEVERRAKYDFKWVDGWTESKFSAVLPARVFRPEATTSIAIIGDKIKMQNGFGAWLRQKYFCFYDTATNTVSDVVIEAGRL